MTEKEFYLWAGKKVKILRESIKMTQEQLSEETGIDQSIISKFENNGKKISAYRLKQMMEVMGFSMAELEADVKKNPIPGIRFGIASNPLLTSPTASS